MHGNLSSKTHLAVQLTWLSASAATGTLHQDAAIPICSQQRRLQLKANSWGLGWACINSLQCSLRAIGQNSRLTQFPPFKTGATRFLKQVTGDCRQLRKHVPNTAVSMPQKQTQGTGKQDRHILG